MSRNGGSHRAAIKTFEFSGRLPDQVIEVMTERHVVQDVGIVEHDDQISGLHPQLADEALDEEAPEGGSTRHHQLVHAGSELRKHGADRREEGGGEHHRVVVGRREGDGAHSQIRACG